MQFISSGKQPVAASETSMQCFFTFSSFNSTKARLTNTQQCARNRLTRAVLEIFRPRGEIFECCNKSMKHNASTSIRSQNFFVKKEKMLESHKPAQEALLNLNLPTCTKNRYFTLLRFTQPENFPEKEKFTNSLDCNFTQVCNIEKDLSRRRVQYAHRQ